MDNTKNPDITWGGNWSVWAGESDRHHGGTKTEATTGSTVTYTFTGTGIEVYSQKHSNFSSFDISIDGEDKGNFSLAGSGTGDDQQLVAAFKELENGEHTIVMTAVDRGGKTQVNLDYFKVFKAITSNVVDKSELQTEIESHSNKAEANYTAETWNQFKAAYDNAVAVMNNDDATVENVTSSLAALREKANGLVAQEAQGPVIPDSAKIEAIGVESKTLVLTWTSIDGASIYEVYEGETKIGETVNNYYRVNDLTADTEYNFTVKAVNEAGKSTAFESITVKTELAVDTERPSNIEEISVEATSKTSAEISWSEATDNVGVVGYKVYVNGALKDKVDGLNYTLEGLEEGAKYTVKVVAIDAAGNTSLVPISVSFVIGDEEVPPTETVDKSELQAVVDSAELLIKDDYTAETWANLESALEKANIVLVNEDATNEDVATAKAELEEAIKALEEKEEDTENVFKMHLTIAVEEAEKVSEADLENVVPAVVKEFKAALAEAKELLVNNKATQEEVNASFDRLSKVMQMLSFNKGDKTQLVSLIEKIEALDSSKYIAKTWESLATVLEASKAVVADENALEEEVAKSYEGLLREFLKLRLKPNKDALNDLINKAQSLDSSKYTRESWRAVEKAVEEADKVMKNEDATEKEIAKAEENLKSAISDLKIASNDTTNSETNNGSNNKDDDKTTSNSKLPKTGGTNTVYILIVGAILVIAGGAFMFTRKKKSDNSLK